MKFNETAYVWKENRTIRIQHTVYLCSSMNMYPQKTWKQTKNNLNRDPSAPEISLPSHPKPLPTRIPLEYTLISTRKTKGSGRRIFSIFREEKSIIRKKKKKEKKEETLCTLISMKETEEIDESFRRTERKRLSTKTGKKDERNPCTS